MTKLNKKHADKPDVVIPIRLDCDVDGRQLGGWLGSRLPFNCL
jgi:hypothetical protein